MGPEVREVGTERAGFARGRRGERKSFTGQCELFACGCVWERNANEMRVFMRVCGSILGPPLWL